MRRLSIEVSDKDVFQVVDDPEGDYVLFADHTADVATLEKAVTNLDAEIERLKTEGADDKAQRAALQREITIAQEERDGALSERNTARGDAEQAAESLAAAVEALTDARVLRDQYAAQLRSIRSLVDVAIPPKDGPESLDELITKFKADFEKLVRAV